MSRLLRCRNKRRIIRPDRQRVPNAKPMIQQKERNGFLVSLSHNARHNVQSEAADLKAYDEPRISNNGGDASNTTTRPARPTR